MTHIARPGEAVRFVAFVLGVAGGRMPVYLDAGERPDVWLDCRPGFGDLLAARVQGWEDLRSAQVEVGVPRQDAAWRVSALWVWADTPDALARAARFRPGPSMVLRVGAQASRRLCLWALERPASWDEARVANERIAYALHSPRTKAQPAELRVPMPGTFMRVGRSRPAPVMVTRMELRSWDTWRQVAGGLKDPPPPDAWKERA